MDKMRLSEAQWRERLSDEEYRVARQGGTERAFTGRYWDCKTPGSYRCVCCGEVLFSSAAKYDSGSGWPSFYQPLAPDRVLEKRDSSLGMERTEVLCAGCDAHLGHVFPDGPAPTGLRYCINSLSLTLDEDQDQDQQ